VHPKIVSIPHAEMLAASMPAAPMMAAGTVKAKKAEIAITARVVAA
jgi:hypothetical protein